MPVFAASLESLIVFVVILAISALGNWLKTRKGQGAEGPGDQETPGPLPRRPGAPARGPTETGPAPEPVFDLERELRRMFGQEPDAPPTPPPPVLAPKPVAPPASPPRRTAREIREGLDEEYVPLTLPETTHFPKTARALDQAGSPAFELAQLEESRTAYQRASSLESAVQTKLDAVRPGGTHALDPEFARSVARSAELAQVLSSLRHPRTARQAILASVILGPPRGSEV